MFKRLEVDLQSPAQQDNVRTLRQWALLSRSKGRSSSGPPSQEMRGGEGCAGPGLCRWTYTRPAQECSTVTIWICWKTTANNQECLYPECLCIYYNMCSFLRMYNTSLHTFLRNGLQVFRWNLSSDQMYTVSLPTPDTNLLK